MSWRCMPRLSKELKHQAYRHQRCSLHQTGTCCAHNIMLLIPDASSTNIPDISKLRYGTDQIYFKSAEEMAALFKEYPEAIEHTLEVAEKWTLELDLKTNHMPKFPIPQDAGVSTLEDYLDKLSMEGLRKRFPEITPAIESRMNHELFGNSKNGLCRILFDCCRLHPSCTGNGCDGRPGRLR